MSSLSRKFGVSLAAICLLMVALSVFKAPGWDTPAHAAPLDGIADNCTDFYIYLGLFSVDIPDPGWAWVNPAEKFQSISGIALKSEITHTDFPVVHDSHDINIDVLVDPGQEDLLSIVNPDNAAPAGPDTMEVEWEIGTHPSETGSDPERTLPKWAWPNQGDRVWVNGHHIYDCGHTTEIDGIERARSEIHPARALASMRDQMGTIPGTGSTPVRTTTTDLWIHGRAGFVTDVLNCGGAIITTGDPNQSCPTNETPIDDDYEFDIPLPPKPFPSAVLAWSVEDGPRNNIGTAPIIEPMPAADPTSLHVTIPLDGTGVAPSDVYSRTIKAGWVYPPEGLRHFTLTLNKMDLHEDMDLDPGDCECTFFWMNVDKAPSEWIRLSTYATGNMNDYDDDGGLGDGEMGFSGAVFDYYVSDGMTVNVRAHGYDQDCLDDYFSYHSFETTIFLDCYLAAAFELEAGDNDDYNVLSAAFGGPGFGVGAQDVSAGGQYELEFTIAEIPVAAEDTADLNLTKICKPDDVGLAGQTITCTIFVYNPGPGLPRNVVVTDTLLTNVAPDDYTLNTPTFIFEGAGGAPNACTVTPPNQFTCELGTVPVGGQATITATFVSEESGDFNNTARVSTDSTDPNLANNEAVDGLTVLPVSDISLVKSDSPATVVAGTDLSYSIEVTNNGPSTANNVVMEDVLPAGVVLSSVAPGAGNSCGDVSGTPSKITCNLGTLADGASETVGIVVTVQSNVAPGTLFNQASARSDSVEPNNGNNSETEATTVITNADLAIVKTSDADAYKPNTPITFKVSVTNNGPSDAQNVVVTDLLPDIKQVEYLSDTAGCILSSPTTLTCSLGTLSSGQTNEFFVVISVKGSKEVMNTVNVTSSTTDPNAANNSASKTVATMGNP